MKKVALFILMSTTSFPSIASAKPQQDNPVVYPVKEHAVKYSFIRILTLGLKGRTRFESRTDAAMYAAQLEDRGLN